MNAVNLIPGAGGTGPRRVSTSPQTLALIAALAAVLIAALVYVSAVNHAAARQGELARATAHAARWQRVASAFAPYVSASQQRTAELSAVRQLAAGRFGWSRLLDQIAQLMPAASALSSLQASTAAGSDPSAPTQPSVQLAGCAASQDTVAQAMEGLRRVIGVSDVELGSSSDTSTGATTGSSSSAAPSSSSGACSYPVQFQISLTFASSSSGVAAATPTQASTR